MKCILFGSSGREAIISKELSKQFKLFAYMSHENPTIIESTVESGGGYFVDKEYSSELIKKYIIDNEIEYCIVNNDDLLAKGIGDIARDCGLHTFGPTKEGSRIEWDKAYATEIISDIAPEALVKTTIVRSGNDLNETINQYKNVDFVIKPNVLTGGKGVKVGGVHFSSKDEAFDYANSCLENDGCVIIQDKMIGREFTIMGFTNGKDLVLAPCTYDYPYRFNGDQGPGTGGMGVVTYPNGLLPFLDNNDIEVCKSIMSKTLEYLNKDGIIFNGVLYGGFFKTEDGIKFIEFNSRLGDPEALNILSLLDTPFPHVFQNISLCKKLSIENCNFKAISSYVVYVVNKDYAVNSNAESITFPISSEISDNQSVKLYCANMERNQDGEYVSVGNSRLFALVKTGDNLLEIKAEVDLLLSKYVDTNRGLDFRTDIGIIDFPAQR